MDDYISRQEALRELNRNSITKKITVVDDVSVYDTIKNLPAADVVKVVRCFDCQYSEPLERNCEFNSSIYLHCILWRGDLTKNVWHKYKKYYRDYSIVEHDEFCSYGVKMDGKAGAVE